MIDPAITQAVDGLGLLCYLLAIGLHLAIVWRVYPAWRHERLALARALCIASLFLAIYAGFVVAHITVRYVLVEWQAFIWTGIAAITRVLYLLVGVLIWRGLKGRRVK